MHPQSETDTLADFGEKYQFRLLYYTCALSDFGRDVLPHLNAQMFDQPRFKQLVTLIRQYWDKYGVLPNVDNLRLLAMQYTGLSPVDKEIIYGELDRFHILRTKLQNGEAHNDSQHVMELAWSFIQDRAVRAVRQELDSMVLMRDYTQLRQLTQRLHQAQTLGTKDEQPSSPLTVMRDVWRERYPGAVATGIPEIDKILPGGLPPGHLGLVLGGTGIGKSSILTILADNAWAAGHDVLHIVFGENDVRLNVMPKYHARWSGIRVDDMKYHLDEMEETIHRMVRERAGHGSIAIKPFIAKDTTVQVLQTWIVRYEEQHGIRFGLIVIDYVDEIQPKQRSGQKYEGQVEVAEDLHQLAVTLRRPIWTATQGNGASQNTRLLYHEHCGGSQEKLKKAQVVLTIGADNEQKNQNKVNVILLKSNISKCGHIWEDSEFDRDLLTFKLSDQYGMAPDEEIAKNFEPGQYRPFIAPAPAVPAVAADTPAAIPAPTQAWLRERLPKSDFDDSSEPPFEVPFKPGNGGGPNGEVLDAMALVTEMGSFLDNA